MTQPPPPPSRIDSWQAAEHNAAAWMRAWGHLDAAVTRAGPDGGIDVRSSTALAQVKFEAFQTGSPAIQRLVGARGREHHLDLYFFSGAGYARPAIDYADLMDVALFQYALDGSMTAVNTAARAVLDREPARAALGARPAPQVELWFWRRFGLAVFGALALMQAPFYAAVSIYLMVTGRDRPLRWGEAFVALVLGLGSLAWARHWHRERRRRIEALTGPPAPH